MAVQLDEVDRVEQLSDASGVVRWQRGDEDPFGRQLSEPFSSGITFDGLFPGQLRDADDDLVANGARHFLPATGRYLQPDPLGLAGGINPYAYAGSDPLNGVDPDGREQKTFTGSHNPKQSKTSLLDPGASVGYGDGIIGDNEQNGSEMCDGLGGITVYLPNNALTSDCISDCTLLHEMQHLRDMLSVEAATNNAVCSGQPYRTSVHFTRFNDLWLSEIHAYEAEIACLKAKLAALKDCDQCKSEINQALEDADEKLRGYKGAYKRPGDFDVGN
jgi:RHS repeat-associated protein